MNSTSCITHQTHSQHSQYLHALLSELKQKHFTTLECIPNDYLEQFDVIGFDVDHTLAIYNVKELVTLLYIAFSEYLIESKGYPKEMSYDVNKEFVFKYAQSDIILDVVNGNALKLSSDKTIVKAYHGINELTLNDIERYYNGCKYLHYEMGVNYKDGVYTYLKGNFEFHAIPLFMLSVHYYDKHQLPSYVASYAHIARDIVETFEYNFKINEPLDDFTTIGKYFPVIANEPQKYLVQYNIREILQLLRSKGKKLFFATNSYKTYGEFILVNAIGDDYKEFFDVGFYGSRKPQFFKPNEDVKCFYDDKCEIDTKCNVMDDKCYERLVNEKMVHGGSYNVVEGFFKKMLKKEEIKCLFVGDDVFGDCYVPLKLERWRSLFITDCIDLGFNNVFKRGEFGYGWKEDDGKEYKDIRAEILVDYKVVSISNVGQMKYLMNE